MSRVDELEGSIAQLPPQEFHQLADWILAQRDALWDEQLDQDAASGRLDFLVDEAREASDHGNLSDLP